MADYNQILYMFKISDLVRSQLPYENRTKMIRRKQKGYEMESDVHGGHISKGRDEESDIKTSSLFQDRKCIQQYDLITCVDNHVLISKGNYSNAVI